MNARASTDARRRALTRIIDEGLGVAVEAAIDIARNKDAPAPARATMVGCLFRAAGIGGFGKTDEASAAKEPYEMTGEELAAAVAEARAELARDALDVAEPDADGVFG